MNHANVSNSNPLLQGPGYFLATPSPFPRFEYFLQQQTFPHPQYISVFTLLITPAISAPGPATDANSSPY
jgi:hypothetical protein